MDTFGKVLGGVDIEPTKVTRQGKIRGGGSGKKIRIKRIQSKILLGSGVKEVCEKKDCERKRKVENKGVCLVLFQREKEDS